MADLQINQKRYSPAQNIVASKMILLEFFLCPCVCVCALGAAGGAVVVVNLNRSEDPVETSDVQSNTGNLPSH